MKRLRRPTSLKLRSHLLLLVLAALVPIVVFSSIVIALYSREQQRVTQETLLGTTRALSAAVDGDIKRAIAMLETLQGSEALDTGDLPRFYRRAQDLLQTQPQLSSVVLAEPSGQQILNLLKPLGSTLPRIPNDEVVEQVRRTHRPAVSGYVMGPLSLLPILLVDAPVLRNGELKYIVGTSLRLSVLSGLLAAQKIPETWTGKIIDRDGVVIATTRGPELIGRRASPELARRIRESPEGMTSDVGHDGAAAHGAFTRSDVSGWTVVLSVPAEVRAAPRRRAITTMGIGGLGFLLLSLGGGLFFGRRIARAITSLSDHAVAVSRGTDGTAARHSAVSEVNDVSRVVTSVMLERRRAQAALEASERQYRSLFEHVPVGLLRNTPDGTIQAANHALAAMLGYRDPEALVGGNVRAFYVDLAEREALQSVLARDGAADGHVVHWRRRDDAVRSIRLDVRAVTDEHGRVSYEGALQDITEQEKAQASQNHLAAIVASSSDAIVSTTPEGIVQSWNPTAERMYGIPGAEVLGRSAVFLVPPDRREELDDALARLREGERVEHFETVRFRRDGTLIDIALTISPIRGNDGGVVGLSRVARDITHRKRAEDQLRESERRYRLVAENVSDVISVSDLSLRTLFFSPSVERLRGYTVAEALALGPAETMTPASVAAAWRVLEEELAREADPTAPPDRSRTLELELYRKDGTTVWAETSFTFLRDRHDRVESILGVSRDISERRQAAAEKSAIEAQLRHAQKMEAVGRLAGGVAHDFNNLLTVITGRCHLILARPDVPALCRRDVDLINSTGTRATALTRQLLAFSRKQVLRPEILDLNATVAGMESMLRRLIGEPIELTVVPTASRGHVTVDPSQIEQVVMNLAVNARDAMPAGGRLVIETSERIVPPKRTVSPDDAEPGRYVVLSVADNGVGMTAEVRSKIFEPFFTTKPTGQGTGLGLSTVYGIVKQSGGHIDVESEPGRGTTVRVLLPMTERAAHAVTSTADAEVIRGGTETVLLAEDEEEVRSLAREILETHGYTVLEAPTPAAALTMAAARAERIDALVSDIVMPRMSGIELAAALRRTRRDLRVVLMSGYSDTAVSDGIGTDATTVFIQKPFSPARLLTTLRHLLDGDPGASRAGVPADRTRPGH